MCTVVPANIYLQKGSIAGKGRVTSISRIKLIHIILPSTNWARDKCNYRKA